jgi:hypothetical protein
LPLTMVPLDPPKKAIFARRSSTGNGNQHFPEAERTEVPFLKGPSEVLGFEPLETTCKASIRIPAMFRRGLPDSD